jgi:hypothetical protein
VAIVDAIFSLIPPNFPSENVDFTFSSKLEHACSYIQAAQEHLKTVDGDNAASTRLLPASVLNSDPNLKLGARGPAGTGAAGTDQFPHLTINRTNVSAVTLERLRNVDMLSESFDRLNENGAAMAAALASAYVFED